LRAALTGEIARDELGIGLAEGFLVAILGAEVDLQAGTRGGQLQPVLAEVAGEVRVDDGLGDLAADVARSIDVIGGRLADGARSEDVPGHAAESETALHAVGHHLAGRNAGDVDDVEGVADLGGRHVVQVGVRQVHDAVLEAGIVIPALGHLAPHARDQAKILVLDVVLPVAAFDVAAADVQVVARGGAAIGESRGGSAAPSRKLSGIQEWIRAIDRIRIAEEGAGGRDLRNGAVVHEHGVRIDDGMLVELVVQERAGGVLLVRALIVVQRAVVEARAVREGNQRAAGPRVASLVVVPPVSL